MKRTGHKNKTRVGIICGKSIRPNMRSVLVRLNELLGETRHIDVICNTARVNSIETSYNVIEYNIDINSNTLFAVYSTYKYVNTYRPDRIINVGKTNPLGLAVTIVGYIKQVSSVIRITEEYMSYYKIHDTYFQKVLKYFEYNIVLHYILQLADLFLPVGKNIKRKMVNNGFNKKDVVALPQPYIKQHYNEGSKRPGNTKDVLFVGRLCKAKGADILLDIIKDLETNNDYQFTIVGRGKLEGKFKRIGGKKVNVEGYVEEVESYYRKADVLLYPTRFDALPNVILEALDAGLPVISRPIGEIPRYVSNICNTREEIVTMLKEWDLTRNKLPEYFSSNRQKHMYASIFGVK